MVNGGIVKREVVFFIVDGGSAGVFEVVVQGFVLSLFVLTQKVTQKVKRNPIAPRVFALPAPHIAVGNMIGGNGLGCA